MAHQGILRSLVGEWNLLLPQSFQSSVQPHPESEAEIMDIHQKLCGEKSEFVRAAALF